MTFMLFISEIVGLVKVGDVTCCCLDGYNCDVYKYLKNDYLTVMVYQIIDEVYKLIGDIYKLEGEYTFAEEYYSKALNYSSVFDIPNDKYEVLYLLAEISEINQDFERMEIRLLNILVDDPFEKNKNLTIFWLKNFWSCSLVL